MPSKILITGGTGLVGSKLSKALIERGDEVCILTTGAVRAEKPNAFYWNLKDNYIDQNAFEGVDYIIHLAGAGIADKPWSDARKKLIYDSRICNTDLLVERSKGYPIKGIVAASAVGYYGMNTDDLQLSETDERGKDFLSDVVVDWEKAIFQFSDENMKVAALRIGIVLSTEGGALKKMVVPFKFGVGSPIGSGKQWMSWIHEDDLVDLFIYALDHKLEGVYNAVAPLPVTNSEFSRTLASVLRKPYWMPKVPSFVLKLIFGEMARVVLGGNRAKSNKVADTGFKFKFTTLKEALTDLLK
jgi:uncharacterized protein (TIGR01777 family)